jgi:hypothetical protein
VENRALYGAHGAVIRNVAKLDISGVILKNVHRTAGRGIDELEPAAAVEHEAWVALGAVRDDEQPELLPLLEVLRRIEIAEHHVVAGLERPTARPDVQQVRKRVGVLDPREHDLGIPDRTAWIDEIDAERVLELGHLIAESDDGVAF